VDSVNKAFLEVAQGSEKISTLLKGIPNESSHQSEGIVQLNTAISEMNQAIQNLASISEEISAASNELDGEAKTIQGIAESLIILERGKSLESS